MDVLKPISLPQELHEKLRAIGCDMLRWTFYGGYDEGGPVDVVAYDSSDSPIGLGDLRTATLDAGNAIVHSVTGFDGPSICYGWLLLSLRDGRAYLTEEVSASIWDDDEATFPDRITMWPITSDFFRLGAEADVDDHDAQVECMVGGKPVFVLHGTRAAAFIKDVIDVEIETTRKGRRTDHSIGKLRFSHRKISALCQSLGLPGGLPPPDACQFSLDGNQQSAYSSVADHDETWFSPSIDYSFDLIFGESIALMAHGSVSEDDAIAIDPSPADLRRGDSARDGAA